MPASTRAQSQSQSQPLLSPHKLGGLELPNRTVMAPMTRARAENAALAPTPLHGPDRFRGHLGQPGRHRGESCSLR
jgi:hypothetical protein